MHCATCKYFRWIFFRFFFLWARFVCVFLFHKCIEPMRSDFNFLKRRKMKYIQFFELMMRPIYPKTQMTMGEREAQPEKSVCIFIGKMGQLRYKHWSVWVHAYYIRTKNTHEYSIRALFIYMACMYILMIRIHAPHTHSMSISGANAHCTHQIPKFCWEYIHTCVTMSATQNLMEKREKENERYTHFSIARMLHVSSFCCVLCIFWMEWNRIHKKERRERAG